MEKIQIITSITIAVCTALNVITAIFIYRKLKSIEDFNAIICDQLNTIDSNIDKLYIACKIVFKEKFKINLDEFYYEYISRLESIPKSYDEGEPISGTNNNE